MLKNLAALTLVFFASTTAQANESLSIGLGIYNLPSNADFNWDKPTCEVATNLAIVNGENAPVLRLSAYNPSTCRIAFPQNERQYDIIAKEEAGCGSKRYFGIRYISDSKFALVTLVDHRTRICKDIVKNLLEVEESINLKPVAQWFHVRKPHGQMTCMAHWTGFDINSNTNQCQAFSASGCSNPFPFGTKESCEEFFNVQ